MTAAVAPKPRPRSRHRKSQPGKIVLPLVVFGSIFVLWEVGARNGWVDTFFLSSPSEIFVSAQKNLVSPAFWGDISISVREFLAGYLAAVFVAIPFGMLTAWYRTPHYMFEPWLAAFNATPRLALLPLVILWVGLGFESKAVIVFLGSFFPIAINTFHGVRTVDKNLLDLSKSFGASPFRRVWTVVLPSTLPFTLVGMRLGVGRGITGVIVAEFFTSDAGIGHFIFEAGQKMETGDLLFGAIFVMVLSLFVFRGVGMVESRFKAWQPRVGSA